VHTQLVKFDSRYRPNIINIRTTVFVDEQGIDSRIDFDGLDEVATHVLVFFQDEAIATGRMLDDGHIGRIAVLKEHRKHGVGAKVLQALLENAQVKGFSRVYLGSQTHATGFYKKLGFTICGEVFMDAGLEHIEMERYF